MVSAAADSCLLYKESPLYCLDLDEQTAQSECRSYEDCAPDDIQNAECSTFSECQKVVCKSSCQETPAGRCSQGSIEPKQIVSWCSPGCCRFFAEGQNFCSYENDRGSCETAARNIGVPEFSFELATKQQCSDACVQSAGLTADATSRLAKQPVEQLPTFERTNAPVTAEPTTNSETPLLVPTTLLILIMIAVLVYYLMKKGFIIKRYIKNFSEKRTDRGAPDEVPKTERGEKQFLEFNSEPINERPLRRLRKVTRSHEEETDPFKKLESVAVKNKKENIFKKLKDIEDEK
ncbi:hypothetical protein COV20_04885 [Candidatus Woesearchaeota archaeon CG10_big_fil_rev_8_21_14_0_10_45_16]|nr:MAG: hypothetical protein COV20_04885 [Candidatus Woesearchaeota archaeon CG10_big_fil_rev_8_21_14_0_10_45_16]